jgi:hypothetical protein
MIISSPLPSLPPLATTPTETETTTPTRPSYMTSTLSTSDRCLIDFTRCLYKAKAIVNELDTFSMKVMPTLTIDQKQPFYNINRLDFASQVDTYLGESFNRFHQMCNALLIVLKNLESKEPMRRESILSFYDELLKEWNRAEAIKYALTKAIRQCRFIIQSKTNNGVNTAHNNDSEISLDSDGDTSIDCQSETSPEPTSSESY